MDIYDWFKFSLCIIAISIAVLSPIISLMLISIAERKGGLWWLLGIPSLGYFSFFAYVVIRGMATGVIEFSLP